MKQLEVISQSVKKDKNTSSSPSFLMLVGLAQEVLTSTFATGRGSS
ncbi:hypothetical protein V7138_05205 [Bacillus sp. JJ1533]